MKKTLIILATCFSFVFLFLLFQVTSKQNVFLPVKSDAILVLGHSLEDGKLPGEWLIKRLEEGLFLYQNDYAPIIIVTGGMGKQDHLPVAQSMKEWLMDHGVSDEMILIEDKARNTYENIKFTRNMIQEQHLDINSILIVSNDFHMYRSMLVADSFFYSVSGKGAAVPLDMNKIFAYLKEPLSICKFISIAVLMNLI